MSIRSGSNRNNATSLNIAHFWAGITINGSIEAPCGWRLQARLAHHLPWKDFCWSSCEWKMSIHKRGLFLHVESNPQICIRSRSRLLTTGMIIKMSVTNSCLSVQLMCVKIKGSHTTTLLCRQLPTTTETVDTTGSAIVKLKTMRPWHASRNIRLPELSGPVSKSFYNMSAPNIIKSPAPPWKRTMHGTLFRVNLNMEDFGV